MNSVDYIVGSDIVVNMPLSIFDDDVYNFIVKLLSSILSPYMVKTLLNLVAFAFWEDRLI